MEGRVELRLDGSIWYIPANPIQPPQELAANESGCGIACLWQTSPNDIFRPACDWHDKEYANRREFAGWGWTREDIDKKFKSLMLVIAGDDEKLQNLAQSYYLIVRTFGWIFFYSK